MHILVVEDEQRLAYLLRRVLLEERHTVDLAHDGQSGLDLALSDTYDVVILDLRMTNGNGIDVLKTIKITRPETKVIIFTNFPSAQYRKRLLDTGADAFLDKSSDFNQIPEIVLKLLETRS